MEWNQNVELDKIKELNTISYGIYVVNENGHEQWENELTNDGKELLDHIQDQVDRAYMVIVRMNYQSKLKVITQRTANERTERLQQHIDKTMKKVVFVTILLLISVTSFVKNSTKEMIMAIVN